MYYEKVNQLIGEIQCRHKALNAELSDFDKQQEDILHIIECGKYNASEGAAMLKTLKRLRKKRRETKDELRELNIIMSKMTSGLLPKIEPIKKNDTYVLKSNVLVSIIGKGKDEKIDLR